MKSFLVLFSLLVAVPSYANIFTDIAKKLQGTWVIYDESKKSVFGKLHVSGDQTGEFTNGNGQTSGSWKVTRGKLVFTLDEEISEYYFSAEPEATHRALQVLTLSFDRLDGLRTKYKVKGDYETFAEGLPEVPRTKISEEFSDLRLLSYKKLKPLQADVGAFLAFRTTDVSASLLRLTSENYAEVVNERLDGEADSFFWTQSVKVYITHGLKFKSFNAISQLKFLIYKNN